MAVSSLPQPERDVDHCSDNGRRLCTVCRGPVHQPLVHNQEIHVSEQHRHEGQLRDELEDEVKRFPEVDGIGGLEEYTQCHMHNGNDHRYLHLQAVYVIEVVLGDCPDWVDAHTIRAETFILVLDPRDGLSLHSFGYLVARTE